MDIYKLRATDREFKRLTLENFESDTERRPPWYPEIKPEQPDRWKDVQYAVCPACNNPITIVGLYRSLKDRSPFGRHSESSAHGVALLNVETREYCPLYNPNKTRSKESVKRTIDELAASILRILIEEFDRVVYLLRKSTGINYSQNLLRQMLTDYRGMRGHCYYGATLINIPWMFAYMTNSKSLYMQYLTNEDLITAIKEKCKDLTVTESGQVIKRQGVIKFYPLNFCFIHHKTSYEESFTEMMSLVVSSDEKTIYQKRVLFDHDHFQNIKNWDGYERNQIQIDLAREVLGGSHLS